MMEFKAHEPTIQFIREGQDLPDAFGAHSRLAHAMHIALTTNPDLEVVGLFGGWGSGKSKVMKLLEARMATETTCFFTYDAWVHQSDAPRRAFLEALITFLRKKELVDTERLDDALAKLLKKVETVEVESQPEVSIRLGLVLTIMLLVPVATQFLRSDWMKPSDGELAYWFLGRSYSPYFTIALYLTLLPAVGLGLITVFRAIMHLFGRQVGGGLTALFVNKGREIRRDHKRSDPEPTALEFQRFFQDILAEVEANGERRLVFVVDNLDRLPDQELMTLWSSIRSLFHGEGMVATRRRPTLLLPLDFAAIERAYDSKAGVAQGFADKTFDIIFRVPPPVSSQWQQYLWARIDEVFGANSRQEWKTIAARVLEDGDIDSRLPRAINIYVNEIATLWLQWRDEDVSFAAMAYYAAKRDAIDGNPWRSLQLQVTWMSDFDPNWVRGVAALRFGATPVVANQILLEQPLREAIMAFDVRAFHDLSLHEGFSSVLRRSVEGYRTNSISLPVANTALLLSGLKDEQDRNTGLVWACLADGLRTDNWELRSEHDVHALTVILQNTAHTGRTRARAALRERLKHWQGLDLATVAPHVAKALSIAAQSAKDDQEAFGAVTLPANVEAALAFGAELGMKAGLVKVAIEPVVLANGLIEHAVANEQAVRPLVDAIVVWQPPSFWPLLVDLIPGTIGERNAEAAASISLLLGEVWRSAPAVRSRIEQIVRGDLLVERLAQLLETGDHARAAVIAALLLLPTQPYSGLDALLSKVARDDRFIAQMGIQLRSFAPNLTVGNLLNRASETTNLGAIIGSIIASRASIDPLSVSPVNAANRLELYLRLLPPETQPALWKTILGDVGFWNQLTVRPYDNQDLNIANRLIEFAGTGPGGIAALAFRENRINAAPAVAWQAALEGGGALHDAVCRLDQNSWRKFGSVAREGVTRAAATLAKREDREFEQRWFAAARRLRSTSERLAYRTLWNRILEPGNRAPLRLLKAGGAPFLKAIQGTEQMKRVLHGVLLRGLGNAEDLRWLGDHLSFVAAAAADKGVSDKALANAIEVINRRISSAAGRPDDLIVLERLVQRLREIAEERADALKR